MNRIRPLFLLLLCGLIAFVATPAAAAAAFSLTRSAASADTVPAQEILEGRHDARFTEDGAHALSGGKGVFWLRLSLKEDWSGEDPPVLVVQQSRHFVLTTFRTGLAPRSAGLLLPGLAPEIVRGVLLFPLGDRLKAGEPVYIRVDPGSSGARVSPLFRVLPASQASSMAMNHVRLTVACFAALGTLGILGILVWVATGERIFLFFAGVAGSQSIYVVYLLGEGFSMPLLGLALPLGGVMWNIPAALSALCACLFTRALTGLPMRSPRLDLLFRILVVAYLGLMLAVLAAPASWAFAVSSLGNLVLAGGAVLVLIASYVAWRRGSRAAGFFLVAWIALQGFTVWRSLSLLTGAVISPVLYYGLPLSMLFSAVVLTLVLTDWMREQRNALEEARRHARIDPLTGVLNRRSILDYLRAACVDARVQGRGMSLLFLDIDHFKQINDQHGHLTGDECLRRLAAPVMSELRQSDAVGRYGGEEFLVVLQGVDIAGARAIAERIRQRIADLQIVVATGVVPLTCSIGVAGGRGPELEPEHLLGQADLALYAAKNAGRNRVMQRPETDAAALAGLA